MKYGVNRLGTSQFQLTLDDLPLSDEYMRLIVLERNGYGVDEVWCCSTLDERTGSDVRYEE